jgi:hypothetical protein
MNNNDDFKRISLLSQNGFVKIFMGRMKAHLLHSFGYSFKNMNSSSDE